MRTALTLAAALLFAPIPAAAAQPAPAAPTDDAELREIRSLVEHAQTAWNAHDAHGYAMTWHPDGSWVTRTGLVQTGRDAIEQGVAEAHRTFFRNSQVQMQIDGIQRVAPDVAVIHINSTMTGDEREAGTTIRARSLMVATRRDGIWRIASGQNTRLPE